MRIVLLGKPGSGKGTQARKVSERFGYYHLSSGEVLREEIEKGTPRGKEVEEYVKRGEIGPEKLITGIVLNHIDEKNTGDSLILDGFPRTMYQAEKLDGIYPPDLCLLLEVSDREVFKRLSNRYVCRDCGRMCQLEDSNPNHKRCEECGGRLVQREDDTPEAIEMRLKVFEEQVAPVISHYRKKKLLHTLEGDTDPEEIYNNIRYTIMKLVGPN